jgi:hypothetical protein
MDVTTATIKLSKNEIEQLIKAVALRLDVGYALGKDKEKESYNKLKEDLLKIGKQIIEGEQINEVNTNRL